MIPAAIQGKPGLALTPDLFERRACVAICFMGCCHVIGLVCAALPAGVGRVACDRRRCANARRSRRNGAGHGRVA